MPGRRSAARSARARARAPPRAPAPRCRGPSGSRGGRRRTRSGDEHVADAARGEPLEVLEDVRPEPWLAGRRLALEGERPLVDAGPLGDETRRLEQLVPVGIALGEDAGRQRVRREDDVLVVPRTRSASSSTNPGSVAPALDEADLGAAVDGVDELRAVVLDRHRRVVRREHEADDLVRARPRAPARPRRRSAAASGACR